MTTITKKLNIYLDFDGTVVEHQFPKIGRCNFGCIEVIKKLQNAGHKIILNTYRADIDQEYLNAALKVLNEQYWMLLRDRKLRDDFKLDPITEWTPKKIHPSPLDFKLVEQTGELFIDDIASKTPLKPAVMTPTRMVDWDMLDLLFLQFGLYKTDLK